MTRLTFLSCFGCLAFTLGVFGCEGAEGPAGKNGAPGETGAVGKDATKDGGSTAVGEGASVSAVVPGIAYLQHPVQVTIAGNGTNWGADTTVNFGADVTVESLQVASPTAIVAQILAGPTAAAGPRDVIVSSAGADVTYAKAFELKAPLSVLASVGTPAQGSVIVGRAEQLDETTPFDPTGGDSFPNLAVVLAGSSPGMVSDASSYTMDYLLFVDVKSDTGSLPVVALSGAQGAGEPLTSSMAPGSVTVTARTATQLDLSNPTDATAGAAFDSMLYEVTVPANKRIVLSASSEDDTVTPGFFLLPASGKFSEMISYGADATLFSGSEGGSYYLVYWDNTGAAAYDFQISSETANTSSEVEPNNDYEAATSASEAIVTGSIDPAGDQDYYAVQATAGQTISVTVTDGAADTCGNAFGGGAIDSELEIFAADGVTSLIANDDDGQNYCSTASFTVDADGTYFVRVGASAEYCENCTFSYSASIAVN